MWWKQIKGFFDNVDHERLMKMLSHDIADRKFLEIIEKFLKAGIMENANILTANVERHRETEPVRYLQIYICIMYWITGLT